MGVTMRREGAVAIVTIDRPEKKNAVSTEMRSELYRTIENLSEDDSVRAMVLTGGGSDFCSGMDVSEFGSRTLADRSDRTIKLQRISRAIYRLKKPTVAAVSGVCMGAGWSYALCCDLIISADNARFSAAFNRTGLAPDAGAAWLLARQIGTMRAKEICYTGRVVAASEALGLGLVLKTTTPEALMSEAMQLAQTLAHGPTLAIASTKRQFELTTVTSFDAFLEAEFSMVPFMQLTEDHAEGVASFAERRQPRFQGR